MKTLTEGQLIELVERDYFGNVDAKDLEGVLSVLAPDARLTVKTAAVIHEGRDTGIRRMLTDFLAAFREGWHGDFAHVVDVPNQRIASRFDVRLVDHGGAVSTASNANFFQIRDGLIAEIFVYMSIENVLK
ncbi:nuclear transport factor 2 family protein [Marinibaculum pumilum]|uniref:Nuclear transport factor 2 family protein n=1 Tax=Marinibaculum pumilum TaxID=1766165 RepID=A0ABV7L2B8_9PROT